MFRSSSSLPSHCRDLRYSSPSLFKPSSSSTRLPSLSVSLASAAATFVLAYGGRRMPISEAVITIGRSLDNDIVIGDAGNAIGAYLSVDQPIVITVDRDISGLNFRTVRRCLT